MEKFIKKELSDYSEDDLFSLVRNPKNIDKHRLNDIIGELVKRGYSEQIDKIENDLIKLNPIYAKFWNRIGAYLIDVLVLGAIGFILGLFFKEFFAQIGSQGLLVGFIISLIYFGLGNSRICNGQTVGKNALKLQVVNKDFDLLTVQKSLLRASVYTVPFFFLNYRWDGWSEFSVLYISKGILFLSFLIILPIHLVVNTPTRQALHDLLLGTYVISKDAYPRQELKKSRPSTLYIAGFVLSVMIGLALIFNLRNNNLSKIVKDLSPIKEQVDKLSEVRSSSITRNSSSVKMFGSDDYISKSEYLLLNIVLKDNMISNIAPDKIEDLGFVQDAIRIILRDYSDVNQLDFIQINLTYGYNIGIYKTSRSIGFRNTIDNWKLKI
jgi:uncharacterized RDD family membrane protein YckC